VRNTDHNTAFPAGITVGATFDKSLMLRRGVAIGEEFRGKGVNIHLGPSVGALGRKPRGGRSKFSHASARKMLSLTNLQTGRALAPTPYCKPLEERFLLKVSRAPV
jgi:hypothetical protein